MNKPKQKFVFFLLLSWALAARLRADAGIAGVDFLKIIPSARAAAMGGALAASNGQDLSSLSLNPAGLASLDGTQVQLTHLAYLQGINLESLALSRAFEWGHAAISLDLLNTPQVTSLDAQGNVIGNFNQSDMNLSFAYGRSWAGIQWGGLARYVSRSLAGASERGLGLDLGAALGLPFNLRAGAALQNLGFLSAMLSQADPLPFSTRLGIAWQHELPEASSLLAELDLVQPLDSASQLRFGLEGSFHEHFLGRFGFQAGSAYDQGPFISLGLGLRYFGLEFDYAFVPYGDLGSTQRLTLSAGLDAWLKWVPGVGTGLSAQAAPVPSSHAPTPMPTPQTPSNPQATPTSTLEQSSASAKATATPVAQATPTAQPSPTQAPTPAAPTGTKG